MVAERARGDVGTASRILDVAERLVQLRGFNGFSYADIAAELGITKPALHYHFASKADLGEALINRYSTRFREALAAIDARTVQPPAKLRHYTQLYLDVLRDQRMCLCGMLAAEYPTLPDAMRALVVGFFDQNEAWLAALLEQGRDEGNLQFTGSARDMARMVISCLEGAMLIARPYGDIPRFRDAADSLVASLATAPAAAGLARWAVELRGIRPPGVSACGMGQSIASTRLIRPGGAADLAGRCEVHAKAIRASGRTASRPSPVPTPMASPREKCSMCST
jgi:TetR/AcrR family transcriptional repressor of nem operon